MSAFKYFTMNVCFSRVNEHEGLLPDCRIGVKESESEDNSSWMHWQHAQQLTFWTMVRVWRSREKAVYKWHWAGQQDVRWLQVRAWHDRSYIAGIPLLAHGLTVKLSPCECSYSGLAGWIAYHVCVGIPNAICYLLRLAPGWFSIFLVYA